jgi:hypothetical protein
MRNVVGVLVAAAVGIHCSAPTESTFDTSAPEIGASQEPERPSPRQPTPATPAAKGEPQPASGSAPQNHPVDLTPFLHHSATTHVTSTTTDESGALYVTGTFVGDTLIGDLVVASRGDKDVFLLKISAQQKLEWVRAVGSASVESSPRVSIEQGARVNVIGMTNGAMDCGDGPLPWWSSSTFFVCVFGGKDGASISGGVFPTGAP